MSTTLAKPATLTGYKQAVAQCLREILKDEFDVYDSLDEISPDLLPCVVLSFDKGVRFEGLAEETYEAKAHLSLDLFFGLSSEVTIQTSDRLSEEILSKILSDQRLNEMCHEIIPDEISAHNIVGEHKVRVVLLDFTLSFLWSPQLA